MYHFIFAKEMRKIKSHFFLNQMIFLFFTNNQFLERENK